MQNKEITASLVQSIIQQRTSFENDRTQANPSVSVVKKSKAEKQKQIYEEIRNELEPSKPEADRLRIRTWSFSMACGATLGGAYGFCLSKRSFRDSL